MDLGNDRMVRCAAATRRLQRHLHGAPVGNPAAQRRLGWSVDPGARCLQAHSQGDATARPTPRDYQQAEIHRLRGAFDAAESDYQKASELGREPQPGLALLRLAQGRADDAASAIRRALAATADRTQRAALLPASVEVMLAAGDIDRRRRRGPGAGRYRAGFDAEIVAAMAAHARGAVELASGNAAAALPLLRSAIAAWQQVAAPYLVARLRGLVGLACRALGDEEGAALEFKAARAMFAELGADPDVARIDALAGAAHGGPSPGLSARESQVLRMVAAGNTNKAIAAALFISEKTVDRHVSNIFDKLDVPSRSAATAYAYKHALCSSGGC